MKLAKLLNSINDFFFKPKAVDSIALLRIFFGILLIYNWVVIWTHLQPWYGVDGLITLKTSLSYGDPHRFSFFDFLPNDPRVPVLLALLNLVVAITVTLGLFTRTSLLFAFLTVLSFHNRNTFLMNSGDIIFRNILFFLIFSPAGKAYSLDRLILRMKGLVANEPEKQSPWALRIIQIQFCVIYVATALFKMKGAQWLDGTAVYTATRLDESVRMPWAFLNSMIAIKLMTWSTLVVELALGTLIWVKEFRYWVLLAGIGLHIGIELTMIIAMFEWVMIATMICMVDPEDIQLVKEWLQSKLAKNNSRNLPELV